MLKRLCVLVGLAVAMPGLAHAQEGFDSAPAGDPAAGAEMGAAPGAAAAPSSGAEEESPCVGQVTETENAISEKMQGGELPEATTDKIYELLDLADAACADGDEQAAQASLSQARALAQ